VLKATLDRAFGLREVLVEPALRALIARTTSLPSIPAVYNELMSVLQSPDASIQRIGATLARDMGMTAKVLQLVNSAFFGLRRHISSPEEAVTFLGVDTVRALALTASAFSGFDASRCPLFSIEDMQQHSTTVAALAREAAGFLKLSKAALDDAFVAGFLHDIGRLVLVSHHAGPYSHVLQAVAGGQATLSAAEREVFGTTHAEVGGYLLWLWGLPDSIVEAVAFHHQPSRSRDGAFGPTAAVHIANVAAEMTPNGRPAVGNELDSAYLVRLGLDADLADWPDWVRHGLAVETRA